MRVAILAVSLLGIAGIHVGHAQVTPLERVTLNGAVPATAIQSPTLMVPERAMPAARQSALVRGMQVRATGTAGSNFAAAPVTSFASPHFAAARPALAQGGTGSSNIAAPAPTLQIRQPPVRSLTDHLLAGVVALMLIAYQLRRKHRVLRPHPFTI